MNVSEFPRFSNESHIHLESTYNERISLPVLSRSFKDKKEQVFFSYRVKHSKHSQMRASQRSIDYQTLLTVLDYGVPFYLQGMIFYTVMKDDILHYIAPKLRKKIKDLVVVLGKNGTKIVTCYKAKNAIKQLRHKSKKLF